MNLHARVLKLEQRAIKPVRPVQVIFKHADEPDEQAINRTGSENTYGKSTLIVVKFINPEKN